MFHRLWRGLKVWRRVPFGPVSIIFRVDRTVRITSGSFRPSAPGAAIGLDTFASARLQATLPAPRSALAASPAKQCAVVVGVGTGFGSALARQLAKNGFDLVLVSRDAQSLQPLVDELHARGATVESCGTDATDEVAVSRLFDHIHERHGIPALVVYSVQYFGPGAAVDIEVAAFETAWRHNCLGAFLVSRCAAQLMLRRSSGSIVLVGSTSSMVGRAGYLNLAVGKFGQRAIAQVLARELWPKGIHVAHVVIDADISEGPVHSAQGTQADPSHIADSIIALHNQPSTAWTSELDLRPWNEAFWEHC